MILKKKETEDEEIPEFHSCLSLNISSCEYTENSEYFVVTLYNPSSQSLTTHVRLPVKETSYQVIDHSGNVPCKKCIGISSGSSIRMRIRISIGKFHTIFALKVLQVSIGDMY